MTKNPLYTVVCTDINDYVNWQFELLEYTWSRINQPGSLVRLVSSSIDEALPSSRQASLLRTLPTSRHPVSGDNYPPYNRLFSLQQWLSENDIDGSVLIIDPDVVFRQPVFTRAQPGRPVGQHWLDFGVRQEFRDAIATVSSVQIEALQPVTWPAVVHTDDLRRLLPRWIELTVAIREQVEAQECDMFGMVVAAAELGIQFELQPICAFMPWPDDAVGEAPLIHYCQAVEGEDGSKIWSKFDYRPWSPVSTGVKPRLRYCKDLIRLLNEFVGLRSAAESHRDDTIFVALASYCEPELVDTIESCLSKARCPENLRFGICHQFDNRDPLTAEDCLDQYSQDRRVRYVTYPFEASTGGCWARQIVQQLYEGETYTLQIDSHTHMVESWDTLLIQMMRDLPAEKPLITEFPPLYYLEGDEARYEHLDDFSRVNTHLAKQWTEDGWLVHPQKLLPHNNIFPRRTRFLSGALVFTLGKWNQEVMQDPDNYYSGEEFSLTLRSYTTGYDLFDPNQIVAWHRCHPEPNRKRWFDMEEAENHARHFAGVRRLRLLIDGDPMGELGPYTLGSQRDLEMYRQFSGVDCVNMTLDQAARDGIRPGEPIPSLHQPEPAVELNTSQGDPATDPVVDVTVYLKNRPPLLLACPADTPVLFSLFQGLKKRASDPDDVMYLDLGPGGQERVIFRLSELVSVETAPSLGDGFFHRLEQLEQPLQTPEETVAAVAVQRIPDDWKIWIWHNINRGCSKDVVFKQLIDNGFSWEGVRQELDHEPAVPLDQIVSDQVPEDGDTRVEPSDVARRLACDQLEIYAVDDFLNAGECEGLIDVIGSRLRRSTVVGDVPESESRTSQTCIFDLSDPSGQLAAEVSARLAKLVGINPNRAEPIQAQVYGPGEEYQAHNDWFAPGTRDFETQASAASGGQRIWSVLVYLNEVDEGGDTEFPEADIVVRPEAGKVVFWNNLHDDGTPNPYALHRACPVLAGSKAVLTLWFRQLGQGPMPLREPWERVPSFTQQGFEKVRIDPALHRMLADYYSRRSGAAQEDEFVPGGFLQSSTDTTPSTLMAIPDELQQAIRDNLQPVCEAWSGQTLTFATIYGIRTYDRGASLRMHTDIDGTHIISVIINVAQQVDQDWPLEIDDHMFRRHAVVMEPGDMLLYEGARLKHGRPQPLQGDYFANVFVHFYPADYSGIG